MLFASTFLTLPRDEWTSMGPGDNSNPGVYFLIGSGTPGVYTRSGVYLDPALKRSYTVITQRLIYGIVSHEPKMSTLSKTVLLDISCQMTESCV